MRNRDAASRKQKLTHFLADLGAMSPSLRLAAIAGDAAIPLDALPQELIAPCLDAVSSLSAEDQRSLRGRIHRRRSGVWKQVYEKLDACEDENS